MHRTLSGLGIAGAILTVVTASAWMTIAAEPQSRTTAVGQAGMRAYVNPDTGKFEAPPAEVGVRGGSTAVTDNALSRTSEVLVETRGTSAAGGMIVDLGDRFESAVTATVGADGKVVSHCRPPASQTD